jgi:hypothetical protein
MSDNERNDTNPLDDQGPSEAERGDEQSVEETGDAAPADDDIIIK